MIRYPSRFFALIPAATLVLAVLNLSVPFLTLAPGPTENVTPLITVDGAPEGLPAGELLLTTVSLSRGNANVADALYGWLDPIVDVVPKEQLVPKGRSDEEVDKENKDAIESSKQSAAAAALRFLGYGVTVTGAGAFVEDTVAGSPADGELRRGDVINAVDGQAVVQAEDLGPLIKRHPAGGRVRIGFLRDGVTSEVVVRTIAGEQGPIVGVSVRSEPGTIELPIDVRIDSKNIGGPSAGLMFALGIVDILGPGDLTGGRIVAGTGTIEADGSVGPVGGVVQKLAAARRANADLFLVPKAEYGHAKGAARGLALVPVATLTDAVRALERLGPKVQAAPR